MDCISVRSTLQIFATEAIKSHCSDSLRLEPLAWDFVPVPRNRQARASGFEQCRVSGFLCQEPADCSLDDRRAHLVVTRVKHGVLPGICHQLLVQYGRCYWVE